MCYYLCVQNYVQSTQCVCYNSVKHYLFIFSLLIMPYGSKNIPCIRSESTYSTLDKTAQPQHVLRSDEDYMMMCTFVLIFSDTEKEKPSHFRKINNSGTIYLICQVRYEDKLNIFFILSIVFDRFFYLLSLGF